MDRTETRTQEDVTQDNNGVIEGAPATNLKEDTGDVGQIDQAAPMVSLGAMAGYGIAGRVHGQTDSFVLAFQIFAGLLGLAFFVLFALRMPAAANDEAPGRAPEAVRA